MRSRFVFGILAALARRKAFDDRHRFYGAVAAKTNRPAEREAGAETDRGLGIAFAGSALYVVGDSSSSSVGGNGARAIRSRALALHALAGVPGEQE
jgi:hypothetical protein